VGRERDLHAERRETAPRDRPDIVMPAPKAAGTDRFQLRGIRLGETRWLGVLTDEEAKRLSSDPVVPGRDPNEPRGVMYDFLVTQHVPTDLNGAAPIPYRLWGAKIAQVSAAPRDWPKELPDRWARAISFSDYQALPEAPSFLRAGLLGDGRSQQAFWARDPDSVVVVYHDKLGPTGRVHVARVTGPAGKLAWTAAAAARRRLGGADRPRRRRCEGGRIPRHGAQSRARSRVGGVAGRAPEARGGGRRERRRRRVRPHGAFRRGTNAAYASVAARASGRTCP
jgi:hypothetical protein